MSSPLSAVQHLEREFPGMRSRVLELAAALDRIARSEGDVQDDPRLAKLHEALAILSHTGDSRAEAIQMLFSLEYDPQWQEK